MIGDQLGTKNNFWAPTGGCRPYPLGKITTLPLGSDIFQVQEFQAISAVNVAPPLSVLVMNLF